MEIDINLGARGSAEIDAITAQNSNKRTYLLATTAVLASSLVTVLLANVFYFVYGVNVGLSLAFATLISLAIIGLVYRIVQWRVKVAVFQAARSPKD